MLDYTKVKNYAPQARRDFIQAVTDRAAYYGLKAKTTEPVVERGDVALIAGREFPRAVAKKRRALEDRIERHGFEQTMESIAYTWFNRFAAIRYMELHGYLDHSYRVLSHPEAARHPEILDHAAAVDLSGLDREKAIELKLDGTQDEALYRLLLLAQCNALHQAMPFLFEKIGDETELLLPANLLHTDSLIRQLVEQVDEALWQEIEIIGWLYQFYISEKKDQVIGKVVKSEDIPAATQLFTPNWIVRYMVQNSLGAQWLATYPDSPLKGQMAYYIEPAEQTDEVNAQLAAITPSQLNPEALTLIDPASGSGHILVEAYELFKAIYLERGYRQRDVPQLILEKNLVGLDIDERAAQLTGFALMMKGRADDRRLFERGVKLKVMALQDSMSLNVDALAQVLKSGTRIELVPSDDLLPETVAQPVLSVQSKALGAGIEVADLTELKRLFEHATTFGSLIQVPERLAEKLPALRQMSEATSQDLFVSEALKRLGPLVQQAELLGAQYDAVVANPPYMGNKGMNALVKTFAKNLYPDAKNDLFACFMERGFLLASDYGSNAMVTMQSWMFLSSFEKMRERILSERTVRTMAHLGARAFGSISGEVVQTVVWVIGGSVVHGYQPVFFRLVDGGESEKRDHLVRRLNRYATSSARDFRRIPGCPIAYWESPEFSKLFENPVLSDIAKPKQGISTCNDELFIRLWFEVAIGECGNPVGSYIGLQASKWFPLNKGGGFRKWYGNNEHVLNWAEDGREIHEYNNVPLDYRGAPMRGKDYFFREGITWAAIASDSFSCRYSPSGFAFAGKGPMLFVHDSVHQNHILGLLNSSTAGRVFRVLSPTLDYTQGAVGRIPVLSVNVQRASDFAAHCVRFGRDDWDAYERSWDFQSFHLLTASSEPTPTLESSYTAWTRKNRDTITEMKRLEEENNRLYINAYGLADELTPDVPLSQITLTVNPAYRYGGKLTEEEQWTRFRQDTMEELVSYAIGCMMGRYSLDEPGLIYAHSGNEGFDPSRYPTFPADGDGIVPLTATEWFDDDAAHRLIEFISVAWDKSHLEANLTFLADNLSPKKNESSRETLRRYLCDSFFKDHLQSYKKRPIYWLFSSGKQKAFQCLVYLHRYNEGTLARIRTEYVIPLQGRIAARIEQLEGDKTKAISTSRRNKLQKEQDNLKKQQAELASFEEKLKHAADQRINLDLDDGVKVNYGKFGDLLAEVKAITGGKEDE